MPNVNYKKLYAIKKNNEKRILSICPEMKNQSGIYFYTRTDENGISYFYIGQSVDCLERNISHLSGFQHIDLSIKKRGFYSEENPYGWGVYTQHCPVDVLNEEEQRWIKYCADKGYQLRNKTSGSQGEGKAKIDDYRPAKGYYDGIKQGKKSLAKELSHIAEKHLEIHLKPEKQGNKVSEKQYEKFMALISGNTYEESDNE